MTHSNGVVMGLEMSVDALPRWFDPAVLTGPEQESQRAYRLNSTVDKLRLRR